MARGTPDINHYYPKKKNIQTVLLIAMKGILMLILLNGKLVWRNM